MIQYHMHVTLHVHAPDRYPNGYVRVVTNEKAVQGCLQALNWLKTGSSQLLGCGCMQHCIGAKRCNSPLTCAIALSTKCGTPVTLLLLLFRYSSQLSSCRCCLYRFETQTHDDLIDQFLSCLHQGRAVCQDDSQSKLWTPGLCTQPMADVLGRLILVDTIIVSLQV